MSTSIKELYYKYAHWIPRLFILFTGLILLLTLMPDDTFTDSKLKKFDKFFHVLFFGIWTFMFWLSVNISKPDKWPSLLLVFAAGTIFGIIIEGFQYILPIDRGVEAMDVLANIVGIIIAILCISLYTNFQTSRKD